MEYSNSVLVDSSYIVSYFYKGDSNYNRAVELENNLIKFQNLAITPFIYLEIATILSQRVGKQSFNNVVLKALRKMSILELDFENNIYKSTKREFLHIKNKNISFVDLHTFLTAKEYGIEAIVSFDKHFKHLAREYKIELIN